MINYDDNGGFTGVSIDIASYAKFLADNTNARGTYLRKSIDYWMRRVLLEKIKSYTPVSLPHTKKDGTVIENEDHARDNWRCVIVPDGSGGEIVQIVNDKIYSHFLEYGGKPGKGPWPSATGDKTISKKDPNIDGFHSTNARRVWAGGRAPGHDKTVGGPIARAMIETGRNTKGSTSYNYGTDTGAYISYSPLITSVINDVFRRVSKDYKIPPGGGMASMLG